MGWIDSVLGASTVGLGWFGSSLVRGWRWWRNPWRSMPHEPGNKSQSSYIVESRGELLWAIVQVKAESVSDDVGSLVSALSVYALRTAEGGEPLFAVDAARLGMSGGGCAYFVVRSLLYGGVWSKSPFERCRLFKYSFRDGTTEFVDTLPDQWNDDKACSWVTPQPAIAPTEEIRGRLKPLEKNAVEPKQQFGADFRIYVGNLPRKVDSNRLQQFFSQHGKVADARVMHDRKTGRSRGFGSVTMAIGLDGEPADAIAKLHGQILDGRPLKVKAADQKQ
ncbi:hypothetical protein ACP70R_004135 [Stipagrostis hirtigluma subsp. patula]